MKPLIILSSMLLFLSINNPIHANTSRSELVIQFSQPGIYKAEIGREFYESYRGSVEISGLRAGFYHVNMYRLQKQHPHDPGRWVLIGRDTIEITRRSLVETVWSDRRGFQQTVVTSLNRRGGNHSGFANHRPPNARPVFHMPDPVFHALTSRLASASFESTRREIAYSAIAQHGISVGQLRIVLNYFNFDSNRLALAKSVHPFVFDPENYFMLTDAFVFESNARAIVAMSHRR